MGAVWGLRVGGGWVQCGDCTQDGLGRWGGLPFEASPSVPLPGGEGGPADETTTLIAGPSLSTEWRGIEGEDSEGGTPQPAPSS